MRTLFLITVFATCFAPAAAQERAGARVYEMSAFCPEPQDWRRYMPERALQSNISGEAVLDCALDTARYITSCQVLEESPANYGFGRAAVNLACRNTAGQIPIPETSGLAYQAEDGSTRVRMPYQFNIEGANRENPRSSIMRRNR